MELILESGPLRLQPVTAEVRAEIHAAVHRPALRNDLSNLIELLPCSSAEDLSERILHAVERGQIRVGEFRPAGGSVNDSYVDSIPLSSLGEPLAKLQESHTIEIELVGEDDEPVPGMAYRLLGPNGGSWTGTLDRDGRAVVDGLDSAGKFAVCFPDLDEDTWGYVSSVPL